MRWYLQNTNVVTISFRTKVSPPFPSAQQQYDVLHVRTTTLSGHAKERTVRLRVRCSHYYTVLSTRRHPAHPVSLPILPPTAGRYKLRGHTTTTQIINTSYQKLPFGSGDYPDTYDTRDTYELHCSAVRRRGNAMPKGCSPRVRIIPFGHQNVCIKSLLAKHPLHFRTHVVAHITR